MRSWLHAVAVSALLSALACQVFDNGPRPDVTPPTVEITLADSVTTLTTLTVSGTASDGRGVANITAQLKFDGSSAGNPPDVTFTPGPQAPFQMELDLPWSGRYWLIVEAADVAGNVAMDSVQFVSDRQAPFFRAVAPFRTPSAIAVVAVYGEESGSERVEFRYRLNGGPETPLRVIQGVRSGEPLFPRPVVFGDTLGIPVPDGRSDITIIARDIAGNSFGTAVSVVRAPAPAQVAVGADHLCMLMTDGSAECVGANDVGQLGDGSTSATSVATPVQVTGGVAFTKLVVGWKQSCGITASGELYCWGQTPPGAAGLPTTSASPRRVTAISAVSSVGVGIEFLCALTTQGAILCWGNGGFGQLGDGAAQDRVTPAPIAGNRSYTTVVADWYFACALTALNEAYCWGQNSHNERGDEQYQAGTQPASVQATPYRSAASLKLVSLITGFEQACGLDAIGAAFCWGHTHSNRLGGGFGIGLQPPLRVQTPEALRSIGIPFETGCAAAYSGQLWCWGVNLEGKRIPSPFAASLVGYQFPPVRALIGIPVTEVTGGMYYTCAKSEAGALYCFGDDPPRVP
jgi:hypothetical protein